MGISAELNWDLGSAKLTSITAWRDNTLVAGNDSDYSGIGIITTPANEGNQTDFKQASEEIRLAGKSGPLDWLVGGFFSSELQSAYGLLTARLGIGAPDGKWTAEIWGNNLANKGIYQVAFDAPFQFEQIDAFLGDPRTFGITLRTKF